MDEDAEFYQAHKDDPQVWGEAAGDRGQKPESRRLNAMVSIRLTPEEEDVLRSEAEKRGMSLSSLVRQTLLRELAPRATAPILELFKNTYTGADKVAERDDKHASTETTSS